MGEFPTLLPEPAPLFAVFQEQSHGFRHGVDVLDEHTRLAVLHGLDDAAVGTPWRDASTQTRPHPSFSDGQTWTQDEDSTSCLARSLR